MPNTIGSERSRPWRLRSAVTTPLSQWAYCRCSKGISSAIQSSPEKFVSRSTETPKRRAYSASVLLVQFLEDGGFEMPLDLPAVKPHGLGEGQGVHPFLVHEVLDRRCLAAPHPGGGRPRLLFEVVDDLGEDDLLRLPAPGGGPGVLSPVVDGVQGLLHALHRLDRVLGHFGDLHTTVSIM